MRTSKIFVTLMGLSLFLISCGGGGGGGSAPPPSTPAVPLIEYTGINQVIPLDENNIEQMTIEAVNGGVLDPNLLGLASLNSYKEPFSPLDVPKSLKGFLRNIVLPNDEYASAAVITETATENGTCGGQAELTLNVDESNPTSFWGVMKFVNFCNNDVTLNGNAEVTGSVHEITQDIQYITLSFEYLEAAVLSQQYALKGSFYLSFMSMPTMVYSLDLYTKYFPSGLVYYLDARYLIATEPGGGLNGWQLIADNCFYCNPTIGCVDFHGTFDYEDGREYPLGTEDGHGNKFNIEGANNTLSFLRPVDEINFKIEGFFHVPEDNLYANPDYDSGMMLWQDYF